MKTYRSYKVKYYTTGSGAGRVRILGPFAGDKLTFPFLHAVGNSVEQATAVMRKLGFALEGYAQPREDPQILAPIWETKLLAGCARIYRKQHKEQVWETVEREATERRAEA